MLSTVTKGMLHVEQDNTTYVDLNFVFHGVEVESLEFGNMILKGI